MAVEASKFLLLDTSENYKQVEILLKWVNELLLKNIIDVYFIWIIHNEHQLYSEVYIIELDCFVCYSKLQSFVHFTSGQKLY